MEVSIFPLEEVRVLKSQFVEARLHADTEDLVLRARIAGLIEDLAKSTAQPIYVAVDPVTENEITRFNGAVVIGGQGKFVEYLEYVLTQS